MSSTNNVQLTPEVEELFCQLVQELDVDALAASHEEDDGNVILLQLEKGDRRYSLLCSASSAYEVNLSPREQEIVRLIARGLSNKAVAAVLDISPATVATHLRRVFSKLNVTSRAEMVACAYRAGLLENGATAYS